MTVTSGEREVVDGWLRRERTELLTLLGSLTDEQWSTATECPAWTVQGVALHVVGDDLSLLSRQRDDRVQGLLGYAETHPGLDFRQLLDGFNEQWVTAATFLSGRIVCELLAQTGDDTAAFYETVDLGSDGEPVGFFGAHESSPYWQIAGREFVERWVHHLQIRRAVDADDLPSEFLGAAANVFVHAMAARFGDLGAGDDVVIGVEIPGVRTWSLRWASDSGHWRFVDAGEPQATVLFAPATASLLLSRGPVPDDAADVITTSGDDALGQAALAALGAMFS